MMEHQPSPEHASMIFCMGVLGGVVFTIWGLSAKFGGPTTLNTTDVATLIAGFGGAALGGGISWLMARQTSREAKERDQASRNDQQRARGLHLLLKYSMIVTDLHAMLNAVQTSLENANKAGIGHLPLWNRVGVVVGSMEFSLDPTDLVPLMDAREYELIATITETFMQHQTLVQSTKMYAELRSEVERLIGSAKQGAGATVYAARNEELNDKVRLYEHKLESLISATIRRLDEWAPKSRSTLFALGPALQKHLGDAGFPAFVADDA